MTTMDSSSLTWELTGKRWMRVGFFTAAVTFAVWILWEIALPQASWGSLIAAAFRFLLFQLAQLVFLLGQRLVVQPEDPNSSSIADTLLGMVLLGKAVLGWPLDPDYTYLVVQRIRVLRNSFVLAIATMVSGFLSLCALTLSVKSKSSFFIDMGVRGAALGLCYICLYTWGKGHLLKFPIIQRQVYFSMKLGMTLALRSALRMAVLSIPVAEVLVRSLHRCLAGNWGPFSLWHQVIYVVGAFFVALIWNLCCHFIQVIHTRRFVFAPPPGSAAAETNPTEPLLSVLEDDEDLIRQYLGFLDLFILSGVSEINVEAWRRAAFFEESGEAYKKVITLCLRPLDRLTVRLLKGLESAQVGGTKDHIPGAEQGVHAKENFQELQLCSWCAGIVSSLTAFSRTEDRYGVAQLTGSNAAVLASLISCLLILDVYLGRRSGFGALSLVSPNGIRWAVPFRGALLDADRKQSALFKKKSLQHRKAHVMADVLRTAIYRIVAVFRDEMVVTGSGSVSYALAERDWLSRNKPLFGTPEMHLQKLGQFIEFQE
ncbi:uncharacterized protein LOC9655136 [Selaginella moellendorffii]|uniref:uncharacterized protein LOC9655136 n=1 Tax=Selaginella moellendorffii TaxID=88036 RepID=UPI000D1C6F6C|nr:uncharacterized protein LOC9655136 [Selaginella moellendorffii]|eukprot:XP_024521072.1 uncharacterized protein LOC9655136 [Selaginella moellendorffii]